MDSLLDSHALALFLDFDGTLVPIAPRPDAIEVAESMAERLAKLAERLAGRLALVSGRALDDIENHLGQLAIVRAGSHGASRLHANGERLGEKPESLSEAVERQLADFASDHGLLYEAKAHGGALHFRGQPAAGDRTHAFARRLATEHALAVKFGKGVAELVHPGADKGGAVRAFMAEDPFRNSHPVFIGDDVTDEDGFQAAAEFGGFGIAVGERESEGAQYRLDSVAAVHQWLRL